MTLGDPFPSLAGATSWILGPPRNEDLAGHALLVHFWSTGCPLCHAGMHDIARLRLRFGTGTLQTIAVFQPRHDESPDDEFVRREAAVTMRIDYACAVDLAGDLAGRFQSEYPPSYYLFDKAHRLRHRQAGNSSLNLLEALISRIA